jgi:hypothetical protein
MAIMAKITMAIIFGSHLLNLLGGDTGFNDVGLGVLFIRFIKKAKIEFFYF